PAAMAAVVTAAVAVTPPLPPPLAAAAAEVAAAAASGSRRRASAAGVCGTDGSRKKPRLSPHSKDGTSAADTAAAAAVSPGTATARRRADCSPTTGDGGGHSGGRWLQPCPSWVLLGSALDDGPTGKGLLRRLAAASGGRVVEQYQPAVTHVLCGTDAARRARRTFKYLMGVAHGAWVLDVGWAAACLSAGHPMPEEGEFAVLGDQTGGVCGAAEARRRRLLCQQQQHAQQQQPHVQQRRRRSSGTFLSRGSFTSPTAGATAAAAAETARGTNENTSPPGAYGSGGVGGDGGSGGGSSGGGRSGAAAGPLSKAVAQGPGSPKRIVVDVGAGNAMTAQPQLQSLPHQQDPNPDQNPDLDLNHRAVSEAAATATPAPAGQMDRALMGEKAEADCGLLLEGVRIHISVGAAVKDDVTALARALGATLLQRIPQSAPAAAGGASADRTGRGELKREGGAKRRSGQRPPPSQQQLLLDTDCTTHPEGLAEAGVDGGDGNGAAAAPPPPLPDPLLLVDPELAAASGGAAARQFSAVAAAAAGLGVPLVSYKWLMTCAGSYSAEPWLPYKFER
ncbi:hypothetical protein Vafri_1817, partial [Volvox africanus]